MTEPTFLERHVGQSLSDFVQLPTDQRAALVRPAFPDLNAFFGPNQTPEERDAPERTRTLARGLLDALSGDHAAPALSERIITDALLRGEADRDQNVYMGELFTRRLTNAVPDLIFQPVSSEEAAVALRWARENGVPVTLRGAGSTAMGGSVPNDGGLTLDLSRFDRVEIDAADSVCVVGSGARLRDVHRKLAEMKLALASYPSNLGGTLIGWFVTGGVGMNAFARGRALDSVRAADVILPSGDHIRVHDDGRLDVDSDGKRRTLPADESAAWFREQGLEPTELRDLAGSEGVLGLVTQLTMSVEPLAELGAFLLSFEKSEDALAAASWIADVAGRNFGEPANLKYLSHSHLEETRKVWADEDARSWRRAPSGLSAGDGMPWKRIVSPAELGARCHTDHDHPRAYVFLDFFDLTAARAFVKELGECPGAPRVLADESVRFASERFKPQQTKRLGPGLVAAEILMPTEHVARFIPRAERLAANVGVTLDAEVYFLADGESLVIGAYLTDHRRGAFYVDLMIAPALVDLAMNRYNGRPYVLGRWQAAWLVRKFGAAGAGRVQAAKQALDPGAILNRGVLVGLDLHGVLGSLMRATFAPGVGLLRRLYEWPALAWKARLAKRVLAMFGGPARGRGAPTVVGAEFRTPVVVSRPNPAQPSMNGEASSMLAIAPSGGTADPHRAAKAVGQDVEDRALHCVNCGECNSVCPIYNESKIRLPQMLTHIGEAARAGEALSETASVLLDLCMRCGNCEEVCQAGIPHLPLYESLQRKSDATRPHDVERHSAIVARVRSSNEYLRDFLRVRPGGYQRRSPASLPDLTRYLVLRSENDAGPAASCIHCGACVAVCPTEANREFEAIDPRSVTTVQHRCIGCGTCVEVCPANVANGGQTLRVMEAPTREWFIALEELERQELP